MPALPDSTGASPFPRAARTPQDSSVEPRFVGQSSALHAALQRVERYAAFEQATILIEGESGTGKSYIARHLHRRSARSRGIFHQVILSAIDDNIAASDLFGHLSGAYTDARQSRPGHFVTANGGTLFLDEIGKASAAVQRKLLHAIEHHEVWPVGADRAVRLDVRVITATNIALAELVAQGKFLPDLTARLTNFTVRLPALRERREDIPALVEQFVELRAQACGHPLRPPLVAPQLMDALSRADWPGNLRQLDAVVQRLLIETAGEQMLTLDHCADDLAYLRADTTTADVERSPELVRGLMAELGSAAAVARRLGVSRWTVYRDLQRPAPLE